MTDELDETLEDAVEELDEAPEAEVDAPDDEEVAAALADWLASPAPESDDVDDDVVDVEPSPVERRMSAVEKLEDLLQSGLNLSQIELVTASDGSLIDCERAIL